MKEFYQIELVLYRGLGVTDQQTLALTFLPVPTKAYQALPQEETLAGVVALCIRSPRIREESELQGEVGNWRYEERRE